MPQSGLIFRLLIASPSDCIQERRIIPEVINSWNAVNSRRLGAIIEPVKWETHTRPDMSDRPQGVVNRQIVDNCDLLVGSFWTRLGTPTGEAESGTVEEIERFRSMGKPVMLYFSSVPVIPESIDRDQYQALTEFRRRLEQEGLISSYESLADFRDQFQRHLSAQMIELLENQPDAIGDIVADDEQSGNQEFIEFRSALENFVRRFSVEWASERDSDPMGIDDGKFILDRAYDDVISLRSMIVSDPSGHINGPLEDVARQLRILSRHQLYMDGGASFREFWDQGNSIVEDLNGLVENLQNLDVNVEDA